MINHLTQRYVSVGNTRINQHVIYNHQMGLVVKFVHRNSYQYTESQLSTLKQIKNESELVPYLDHENIIKLEGIEKDERGVVVAIQMKRADCDMHSMIQKNDLNYCWMLNAFKQVVDAVAYLHDNKVAHLDIRSSNIFVFEGKAVLSDFGFATKFPYYEKVSEFFDQWSIIRREWEGPEVLNALKLKNEFEKNQPILLQQELNKKFYDSDFNPLAHDIYQLGFMLWNWFVYSNYSIDYRLYFQQYNIEDIQETSNQNFIQPQNNKVDQQQQNQSFNQQQNLSNESYIPNQQTEAQSDQNGLNWLNSDQDTQTMYFNLNQNVKEVVKQSFPFQTKPDLDDPIYILFQQKNIEEIKKVHLQNRINPIYQVTPNLTNKIIELVCECIQINPSQRPTAKQIQNNILFQKIETILNQKKNNF